MENPYKQAVGAAPATAEEQRMSDYQAAIGPNREYYLPRFEEFDRAGSAIGWHWPAFFATSPWFLYRKMWLPGILNLVYPFVLLIVCSIGAAFLIRPIQAHPVIFSLLLLALLAAPWFLLPMYANVLYWRHIGRLIEKMPRAVAQVPEKRVARLEREGGTGAGAMIAVCAGLAFFVIFIVGVLAAIAIPAYQDYTIRAQVTEGLNLATPVKAAVAEFYAKAGTWPGQADLGAEVPSGKYVAKVVVKGGSVIIIYGRDANTKLQQQGLALGPAVSAQGDIVWICGNADAPAGVVRAPGPTGSDLPNKYLPSGCRPKT
jgi:type IV pilus assembly protein PilA